MSMFSLSISCLTTFNLQWFMDLTFQVAMKYCSLWHCTLLPSPVTSTTGHCFFFGSISSSFLEVFLHLSPVAYWTSTDLRADLSVSHFFLPFHTDNGVLKARILKWFALPFFSSVQFSPSVVSDPLQPHELQHARPPCPSPTPKVYSNLCPSSQWCHLAISSSVIPFSFCFQSFPPSGSFSVSQLFISDGQGIGTSA